MAALPNGSPITEGYVPPIAEGAAGPPGMHVVKREALPLPLPYRLVNYGGKP